jgi:UDP-N-acetylglucosamine/UDP-N-acetylgalactosamine diphosphorylase
MEVDSMNGLQHIRRELIKYGQEHLLKKFDDLDQEAKERLIDTAQSIDFGLMRSLYQKALEGKKQEEVTISPIQHICKDKMFDSEIKEFIQAGETLIRAGKLTVVTMAGGQGTRLGFNGPKGAFIFDPDNGKSIFEALADTMKEACERYDTQIIWYIMVSKENHRETKQFFEDHKYFGYPGKIIFFIQGELPMLDQDGKILLDENYQIKMAANGHGGTLNSMEKEGVLAHMKANGIKWVSINGVDNVLVKPIDPLFIGIAASCGFMGAIKSIEKANPEEKVGVICRKNGKVGVVEYTEISKEMAYQKDDEGNLVYGDAYALFNLFSIEGLERVSKMQLPYHVAFKKANYIDSHGTFVEGTEPNSYKFEQFIFDAFQCFDDVCVLRVKRDDEFAPIKNAEGVDSPETALRLYRAYKEKAEKEL